MKIIEWKNIPTTRFPINIKYVLRWIAAPIKPFIFTQVCKIDDGKYFCFAFKIVNFIFLKWKIKIKYLDDEKIYKVEDNFDKIYVKRKTYINLYAGGIQNRLKKLEKEYLLENILLENEDIVIDVGACVGEVSMILGEKYKCKIFSFEPEEDEYKCMLKNINNKNFQSYNLPLWNEIKEISFYSANELHDSSCFETEDYTHEIKKKTSTLNEIFKELLTNQKKIKLLKLEAEGAEPEILKGADKILPIIKYISADVGAERGLKYETTIVDTIKFLETNNFELIKVGTPRLVCLFKNKRY